MLGMGRDMTSILPKIDKRSREDLAEEIRRLMLYHCPEFESIEEIKQDKQADALINIFANMMEHVIDALNKSPEKNYTAFLNLIGVSPISPKVARAALVFKLKEDWDKDGFIPAGTKLSAQPENQEEVVFETENDLTVIRPGLVRVAGICPEKDKWSDFDFLLSEESTGQEAEIFNGETPIVHRIYIGHKDLLSLKNVAINLNLKLMQKQQAGRNRLLNNELDIKWFYFDDKGNAVPLFIDAGLEQSVFSRSGEISFEKTEGISQKTIEGYDKNNTLRSWTNYWIFAELKSPLINADLLPDVENINISVDILEEKLRPESAVFNYAPIDLTKDFYPFGERPAYNDTFYISCRDAFSKEDAIITLNIALSEGLAAPQASGIILGLEYWDGVKWTEFGKVGNVREKGNVLLDETEALTKQGKIVFRCPKIEIYNLNGEENYWIRLRIIGGNYGTDSSVIYHPQTVKIQDEEVTLSQVTVTEASYLPPSLKEILIDLEYKSQAVPPEHVITENNFLFVDRTEECFREGKTFKIFSACTDADPALYLGFDRDISNLPISLFFPLTGDQVGQVGNSPVVAWEYWNGRKWLTLSVNDAVRDFTRREIQQLAIPVDIEKTALFGSVQYWIRARLESGGFSVLPRVNAIYSNAVWAANASTVKNQIIGSSNGEPNQTFQFSGTPVLSGHVVKVRETLGQGDPVIWTEVQSFSLSGPESRHYMLDSASGTITFGDGKNGMIPPAGKENIISDYRYGGGAQGNVKANTITKLWDNFVEIDSVTNPLPADGGFDQEDIETAKIRGPHTLKSWDRGITCDDVEWLVREAAPQIALVKCFPTMNRDLDFTPGKATVIVVPKSNGLKPVPSQEMLNEIDRYLSQRIAAVLNTSDYPRLDVIGPEYIRIGVEATVVYTNPESGKIIEGQIMDNLREFLNPLRGGQEKTGWSLGKNLYISEVCTVIKNTPGVDYISSINIKSSVQCYTLYLEQLQDGHYKPSIPYPTYSAVKSRDNRIVLALAEKLEQNKPVKTLLVKGFREGHRIDLKYRNYPVEKLVIKSVDGDILECYTASGDPLSCDYPVGSDIETAVTQDLSIRSFILNELKAGQETFFIKMAVLEPRDIVYLSRNDEYTDTVSLKITEVMSGDVFLEEDELVFSGEHLINKKPDLQFPYLLNRDTKVIHDVSNTTDDCRIHEILKEDREYLTKITDVEHAVNCPYCIIS